MLQNTSHAVMSQRHDRNEVVDDFPTPPWATRAFVETALSPHYELEKQSVLEPACGRGYMSSVLNEYFGEVIASDKFGYGTNAKRIDFLSNYFPHDCVDWVITNPPFSKAEQFISRGLEVSRLGVAVLTRTVFIESIGRFERLFSANAPAKVFQYSERVPMVKGRVDRKASTATGYCWCVWTSSRKGNTELGWIPPLRKKLERIDDYETISSSWGCQKV